MAIPYINAKSYPMLVYARDGSHYPSQVKSALFKCNWDYEQKSSDIGLNWQTRTSLLLYRPQAFPARTAGVDLVGILR